MIFCFVYHQNTSQPAAGQDDGEEGQDAEEQNGEAATNSIVDSNTGEGSWQAAPEESAGEGKKNQKVGVYAMSMTACYEYDCML